MAQPLAGMDPSGSDALVKALCNIKEQLPQAIIDLLPKEPKEESGVQPSKPAWVEDLAISRKMGKKQLQLGKAIELESSLRTQAFKLLEEADTAKCSIVELEQETAVLDIERDKIKAGGSTLGGPRPGPDALGALAFRTSPAWQLLEAKLAEIKAEMVQMATQAKVEHEDMDFDLQGLDVEPEHLEQGPGLDAGRPIPSIGVLPATGVAVQGLAPGGGDSTPRAQSRSPRLSAKPSPPARG